MITIPVVFLVVSMILGLAGYALSVYWGAPPIEYFARMPRWATITMVPLAVILLVVSAIEYAVRKDKTSSALPWALGFVAGWLGAWAGNAAAGAAKDKILP